MLLLTSCHHRDKGSYENIPRTIHYILLTICMSVVACTDPCSVARLFGVCILWGRCSGEILASWHTATHTHSPPGTHLCLWTKTVTSGFSKFYFRNIGTYMVYLFLSFYFSLPTHSSLRASAVEFSGVVGCFLYPGGHSGMQLCPSPAKMSPYVQEQR